MGYWSPEARRKWFKKWYKNPANKKLNRERVKAWQKKNRDKVNKYASKYRRENRATVRKTESRFYKRHREELLKAMKKYYKQHLPGTRRHCRNQARKYRAKYRKKYNTYHRKRNQALRVNKWKPWSKVFKYRKVR